jgi:hypothetical protein
MEIFSNLWVTLYMALMTGGRPKIQKSKNPKTQKPKNFAHDTQIQLTFWVLVFAKTQKGSFIESTRTQKPCT